MNNNLKELLGPINNIKVKEDYKIINNKYVIKDKTINISNIYNYLHSRSFDYFIPLIYEDSKYEVYEYKKSFILDIDTKGKDIIYLTSLLHSKTTIYKEIDIDKSKKTYEDIKAKAKELFEYYNNLITNIETEVFMSPSSYLLARNINIINSSINFIDKNIDSWYEIVKNKSSMRYVYTNNNINLDHYIKEDKMYLTDFSKSSFNSPIYDLLSFYKRDYLELDFLELFKYYESMYPLKEEERILLFIEMIIIPKIGINDNEYENSLKINKMIDYLYKTNNIIMNYFSE